MLFNKSLLTLLVCVNFAIIMVFLQIAKHRLGPIALLLCMSAYCCCKGTLNLKVTNSILKSQIFTKIFVPPTLL